MTRLLIHGFSVAVALAFAAWLLPGVQIDTTVAWLAGSLALTLVNTLVRPVLVWLTLPLTVITLGLFLLVVNALAFGLSAWLVPGFEIASAGAAVLGALIVSLASSLVERGVRDD
jgi:putative membrane protein